MKKHILLTTTAMLLSAVAMNTNAASNSAELEISASFMKPFEFLREQYLGFGMILADEGGKTVIVKNDGTLDPTSTATMMSTSSFTNYSNAGFTIGSLNEGLIRAKGFLTNSSGGLSFVDLDEGAINALATISFSNETVELKDNDGNTCGTVSGLNYKLTKDGEDVLINVGVKLTTADLRGITGTIECDAYTTVTVVLNENNFAAAQNSFHQGW